MSGGVPANPANEFFVGPHFWRWEPPDIGYLRYDGDMTGELSTELTERSRAFTLGQPIVFLLVDVTRIGKVSAEARARSGQGAKDLNLRGTIIVGASASIRIVVGLVTRAIELVHGNKENPTRFFDTEAEARAWIAQRRELLHKR